MSLGFNCHTADWEVKFLEKLFLIDSQDEDLTRREPLPEQECDPRVGLPRPEAETVNLVFSPHPTQ